MYGLEEENINGEDADNERDDDDDDDEEGEDDSEHDFECYENYEFTESNFDSDDLWSEYDSSEDENMKIGCQVKCEKGCPFYIWVSQKQETGAVEIRALLDDHLCIKPYKNRLATVKYMTEIYGDRLRKNPQWKIKDMMDTMREDLEIEVPRIKILRVRKAALEGVHNMLKDVYARIWDFGAEIMKNNPLNTKKDACSIYRDPSHKRTKCPMKPINDTENEPNAENPRTESSTYEDGRNESTTHDGRTRPRQKLQVRRTERSTNDQV
ncbi:hypothetical protein POM88_026692 [Heracleum sosnowskyi]|uniref:Uncharacterized protein n=1 Tax=Heracleum sosnowskyi TaxID=360622 RepID=A0AAD8I8R5_9APIA|nr:hypothetical protein POM88_026692 [Heracleum sosnowskyi]